MRIENYLNLNHSLLFYDRNDSLINVKKTLIFKQDKIKQKHRDSLKFSIIFRGPHTFSLRLSFTYIFNN